MKREKPSARSVPISRLRFATAAYIVIIAPIIAPIEKKNTIAPPRHADQLGGAFGLLLEVVDLAQHLQAELLVALDRCS